MKKELKKELSLAIATATGIDPTSIEAIIEKPKNRDHGDLAFPCFTLAKIWKLSPPSCASKILETISLPASIEQAIPTGPFLNFRFRRSSIVEKIVTELISGSAFQRTTENSSPVIVEYSSPNIAKPFHVGHLRATLIGNCLDRLDRALGHNVVSINHLGDWGTQFGFVWAGCEFWGKPEQPSVASLVELYRRSTALKEEQEANPDSPSPFPNVNEVAREYFIALEKGEPYAIEFWQWCREISLHYLEHTYQRLHVRFDHYTGESFYSDKLEAVKKLLVDASILTESQGALGVELNEQLGFARIYTPDGRSLYLTRDLATAIYRADTFQFSKAIYVVGAPQTLHFQQLVGVLKRLGKSFASKIEHVAFGHVMGMKTRGAGEFIELNDFLDEAFDRSLNAYREQVSKRPEGLDEQEVAQAVALSAILFSTLSRTRTKDVHFSWDHALEFQGDSGPYLLYAYARMNGIREKAMASGIATSGNFDPNLLTDDTSYTLVDRLLEYDGILTQTSQENDPAVLCNYALDLAKDFSKSYNALKVLGEEPSLALARLQLFEAVRMVLREAIELLGMTPLERM